MKITWYGHAAFLIEGQGKRIIMDPFSPASGYDPIDEPADILCMSQDDDVFHSHAASVRGNPLVINGRTLPDEGVQADGITFKAVKVWEDLARTRNLNGMIHFRLDGVWLCHMGDLGHPLSDTEIAPIVGVDVLLALAGGAPTIALDALTHAIERIGPRLVIPMHYQTGKVRLNIRPLDELLRFYPAALIERRDSASIEVGPETLPASTRIVVLQHAR
jgi:L-ascorbate metabolism protein UlaG (beta-lactamase superfamily)